MGKMLLQLSLLGYTVFMEPLNILFIEPFYGGSHKAFADGFAHYSNHKVQLFTLPARFWKWRMRGAALEAVRSIPEPSRFDLVCAAAMLSLADLKALWGTSCPPLIAYFHENQLNYPLAPGETRDFHYGFTDITTGLAADRIIFNSHYHKQAFFDELPRFIRPMPDTRPTWAIEALRGKSTVIYPGIEVFQENDSVFPRKNAKIDFSNTLPADSPHRKGPLILWNHRWEHDKNPESFFHTLFSLAAEGLPFRLAVAGEHFTRYPEVFSKARTLLSERIVHFGYIENRSDYYALLHHADIVVSTAYQENFGLSIAEAVAAGCVPLLPQRLSYPELIPSEYHSACLYKSEEDLTKRLRGLITDGVHSYPALRDAMKSFSWSVVSSQFDELCAQHVPTHGWG